MSFYIIHGYNLHISKEESFYHLQIFGFAVTKIDFVKLSSMQSDYVWIHVQMD